MKRLIFIFVSCMLFAQTEIPTNANNIIISWDRITNTQLSGYTVYFPGIQRTALDTFWIESRSTFTTEGNVRVAGVSEIGEIGPLSDLKEFVFIDSTWTPTYDENDIPFFAGYNVLSQWQIVEPGIRRSNLSYDSTAKEIKLNGYIGPAFIFDTIDFGGTEPIAITFRVNVKYAIGSLHLRVDNDLTVFPSDFAVTISVQPGRHKIYLEALNNTVVLKEINGIMLSIKSQSGILPDKTTINSIGWN